MANRLRPLLICWTFLAFLPRKTTPTNAPTNAPTQSPITYNVASVVIGRGTRSDYPPHANPIICATDLAVSDINADATLLANTQIEIRQMDTNCSGAAAASAALKAAAPYW